ncbi:hypothetical protein QYE76_012531 [Lolium multiflorum]|uniref:Transposase (putative) gypsy type domain-containing protein n=1 Tax=Lolium multiflorum TaxID=4521 RepID=A0AAD8U201_LOLMU|nr:hypothetical protein QYE76_012531 [Lolium multiflorum]
MESPSRITDSLTTVQYLAVYVTAFHIRRTGSGFLMGLHGSGFLQRSVRIRLSDPGPDFILHDQQQLGRPMGHMPPSPSMGHPGLPDLGTVDAPPASSSSAVPEPAGKSPERHRSESTTVVFFVFLTTTSHRTKTSPPATPTTAESIVMSSMTPPPADEPINATPISSAPPPFIPIQLDPTKDSGKDVEGTSAIPEKTSEAEKKTEEMAAKKSKARQRDSESKGKWWPCTTTNIELQNLEGEGFLQPGSWRATPSALAPAPQDNEMVLTKALVERGFSFPPSDFFLEILKAYGLQPHNISPNSVLAISNHVTLCEGHLRVAPELSLFQYYFTVKKERIRQSSELATCGTITFMLRPGRVYPHTDRHESARYWSAGFFYLKDVSDPANANKLPPFKNCPATELLTWSHCPHISESLQLTRAVRRICKLTEEGLTGKT